MVDDVTSKKEITFEIVRSTNEKGVEEIVFIPDSKHAEMFLKDVGLDSNNKGKHNENLDCEIKKCTVEDFMDIFQQNDKEKKCLDELESSMLDLNYDENMVEQLGMLGLNFDEDIEVGEIEEMEDDFVVNSLMDNLDDDEQCLEKFVKEKKKPNPLNYDILLKYEDMSSNEDDKTLCTNEKFTTGTMVSASSVPRSEGLKNLDCHFESVLREYVDREDSDYSCSELFNGLETQFNRIGDVKAYYKDISLDNKHFQSLITEFMHKTKLSNETSIENNEKDYQRINNEILERYQHTYEDADTDDECDLSTILKCYQMKKKDRTTVNDDFESDRISSTSYRPDIIHTKQPKKKIVISKRSGIPREVNVIDHDYHYNRIKDNENDEIQTYISQVKSNYSSATKRNKNESKEEKKLRKLAIKQYKQIRRCEKKANTIAFNKEKHKIQATMTKNSYLPSGKSLI